MAAPTSDRDILDHTLSILLGFDDGVADVVDHLLTIGTSEELIDYLSQLLGSDGPAIRDFVDQVARFKRKEPLVRETSSAGAARPPESCAPLLSPRSDDRQWGGAKKPSAGKSPAIHRGHASQISPSRGQSKLTVLKAAKSAAPAASAKKPNLKVTPAAGIASSVGTSQPPGASETPGPPPQQAPSSSAAATAPQPPPPVRPPARGTNPVDCGCYGRLHPPLTNCLYCGRVACEIEGYGYCPYCGYEIEPPLPPPPATSEEGGGGGAAPGAAAPASAAAAWRHKERLLRYDRDFASRTAVFDDQADYYSKESAWLTEDERIEAEERERQQQQTDALRRRMQLNLRI